MTARTSQCGGDKIIEQRSISEVVEEEAAAAKIPSPIPARSLEEEEEVTESDERASKRHRHEKFIGMNGCPCFCVSIQGQWVTKGGGASCLEIYLKGGGVLFK